MTKKGTVWVIGASSGLGLHTAQAFAESGWLVIAGARSFEEAQSSFEMKASENPIRLRLDVTSEESCDRFQREALRISPRVDVLVCGAAVLVLGSCELTEDVYKRQVWICCGDSDPRRRVQRVRTDGIRRRPSLETAAAPCD